MVIHSEGTSEQSGKQKFFDKIKSFFSKKKKEEEKTEETEKEETDKEIETKKTK